MNHETRSMSNGFFKDIVEKRERLRGKSMPAAGLPMQAVEEFQHGFAASGYLDAQIVFFRLSYRPSDRA